MPAKKKKEEEDKTIILTLDNIMDSIFMKETLKRRTFGMFCVLGDNAKKVWRDDIQKDEGYHGPEDRGGVIHTGYLCWIDSEGNKLMRGRDDGFMKKLTFLRKLNDAYDDGGSAIFQSDIISGHTIPTEWHEMSPFILNVKKEFNASDQDPLAGNREYTLLDIMKSYTPVNMKNYRGNKTKISSALAIPFFYRRGNALFEVQRFRKKHDGEGKMREYMAKSTEPVYSEEGDLLFVPCVTAMHGGRYLGRHVAGVTRIMPHDTLGRFFTMAFEYANHEFMKKTTDFHDDSIIAYEKETPIVAVVREYPGATVIGRRPISTKKRILRPDDWGNRFEKIVRDAKKKYNYKD